MDEERKKRRKQKNTNTYKNLSEIKLVVDNDRLPNFARTFSQK